MNQCRWSPNALGLCLGILSALSVLTTAILLYFYYPQPITTTIHNMQFDIHITVLGSVIAILIGFVHAYIMGYVVAWLYNLFVKDRV